MAEILLNLDGIGITLAGRQIFAGLKLGNTKSAACGTCGTEWRRKINLDENYVR